jgi:hypothetical protein
MLDVRNTKWKGRKEKDERHEKEKLDVRNRKGRNEKDERDI